MRRRLTLALALTAAATVALSGCTSTASDGYTIKQGQLTTCADVPYPPFEDFDSSTESGFTGFDVEIVGAIAERLNLELVVRDVDFDALQSGIVLAAGECDMGSSAITITEARQANLDFADPYYDSLQSLLVPKASGITGLADLENGVIGVQAGTTGRNYAFEHAPKSAQLKEFPSDGELWPALQAGQIDAILQDLPVNNFHLQADSSYVIVEQYNTDEQYGFAFAKGERTKLIADINAQLAAIRADGTYQRIYDKWFTTGGNS
ncbi:MAG: transporter substrate-binding domain-containing protein [Propionibacteriaceae bacterium]|jgi:polar amino acid transport system substrate-binding protein|nr:transporter substrate-binding domain-containing protein [Propionibacteriaceae bacterium]